MRQDTRTDYNIFIRLKPQEKPFRIRIASNPKNFRSHRIAFKSISKAPIISPAYSIDDKGLDIAWAEGDWLPQRRHSCLVFDRDDGNRLKILESGDSLFAYFGNLYKTTGINPVSSEGMDWFILAKGGTTEYSATPDINSSPFTEEEKITIANPPFDIGEIIKLKTPEEIKMMWLKLDDSRKYDPKSKYRAGTTFNKSEFEKRYGKTENKPVVEDEAINTTQPVTGNSMDGSNKWEKDELPF